MTTPESTALEVRRVEPDTSAVVLWGTDDPRGMTARMAMVADAMAEAVRSRGMSNNIDGREYVRAEGWALVGAMVGIFPRTASLDEIREDGTLVGFRATTELVARDGAVVGGAVALCTVSEARWANRDWNQIASMAQTRANAKAYRQTLGFIMPMAGYAATPAEEMDGIGEHRAAPPRQEQTTGEKPMHNSGDFLMACNKRLGLKRDQVLRMHNAERGEDLSVVMMPLGSWEALFEETERMAKAVTANA